MVRYNPRIEIVLGFSQGAAFLALLCQQLLLPLQLRVILVAGFCPLSALAVPFFTTAQENLLANTNQHDQVLHANSDQDNKENTTIESVNMNLPYAKSRMRAQISSWSPATCMDLYGRFILTDSIVVFSLLS